MKKNLFHIFYVLGILLCLSSCSKNNHEPYKPTEWQYDKYLDPGILPGDDFYRFVCGKGIAAEGLDLWAPFPCWMKQERDYLNLALSDGDDNPVPVLKRLNKLRAAASSEENIAAAFANMRERLNGIEERTKGKDFIEKAAEYCKNGYSPFKIAPIAIDGHRFGFGVAAVYMGAVQDCDGQLLDLAGIKDKYDNLLPKARMFEKYLLDNIQDGGTSIQNLDAGNSEECRQMKEYVEACATTKAGGSALERFASALGNKNPDFIPIDDAAKQYFELVDKMDAGMMEAADAFLWCMAVSFDMSAILYAGNLSNLILSLLYPNLVMNLSRVFCEKYVNPECEARNRKIFEALRSTMAERIEQSEWMTPYSKASAKEKLDAMECHLGILDWSRYEADMPVSGDFCSAQHEVGSSCISKMMAISGENGNLDHIIAASYMLPLAGIPPFSANSFYIPPANAMCILPSSSVLMDMNPEFPFMMFVVAHELCHGFDANGANYNARGQFGDWWSIDDKLAFRKKQEQLIGIFNRYYVGGTTFCDGAKTTNEDMADLGGLEIAYYTAVKELEEKFGREELLEMKRRFFKSYAIYWAQYFSIDEKIQTATNENDPHTINEYRVNGIVNNFDDWYQLFEVTPERKFYLSPERRVYLW